MKDSAEKRSCELASEIMPDGLVRERSGLHSERFYNSEKNLKKTSKNEIFAKTEQRKAGVDLN